MSRTRAWRFRGGRVTAMLAVVLSLSFPLAALAGFVYSTWWPPPALKNLVLTSHPTHLHCGEGRSAIGTSTDPGEGWGYIRTRTMAGTCSGAIHAVPAGYLGAAVRAWRTNPGSSTFALCSTTGTAYTAQAWSEFGVGALLCSNPAGAQEFYAQARPVHGYDSLGQVLYKVAPWGHNSPIQSY